MRPAWRAIGAIVLALTRAGDHVVASQYLFGNTVSLLNTLSAHGIEVSFVDATDVAAVEAAITPATKFVFVETIANPRTQVADLARIGAACAARGILYIVDNTMTSPALFRPKSVGAGLVVNALTKYIGGHGNALGGSITDTGLFDWTRFAGIADTYKTAKPALWGITQLRKKGLRDFGATLAAVEAHHLAVGAETLALADGAHVRERAGGGRVSRRAAFRRAPSTTRASPRIRSMRSRGNSSAASAGSSRSSSRAASTASIS